MTELPVGWAEATLAELGVEAQSGFPSGRHNKLGQGIPHLRPMNIDREGRIDLTDVKYVEDPRDLRLRPGDVLFNNTNSPPLVGKTAYLAVRGDFAFSNHMTRLRVPQSVDGRFLAIQLHFLWRKGVFRAMCSHHVNQASVTYKALLSTQIALSAAHRAAADRGGDRGAPLSPRRRGRVDSCCSSAAQEIPGGGVRERHTG